MPLSRSLVLGCVPLSRSLVLGCMPLSRSLVRLRAAQVDDEMRSHIKNHELQELLERCDEVCAAWV